MNIAITHDWLTNWGGGESVLRAIAELFPDAHIYSAIVRKDVQALLPGRPVVESWLGRAPMARTRWQWYLSLLSYAFRSFDLSRYDLVIASSYYAAHHVRARRVLCYKHSPARAVWGDGSYLAMHPSFPGLLKPLAKPQLAWFKKRDLRFSAADYCDMVANSHFCAAWAMNAYGRDDVQVVHPPVDVGRFTQLAERRRAQSPADFGGYWMCWSRHAPQKRLQIIVEASAIVGEPLVLAGSGAATASLRQLARERDAPVEFVGRVDDAELDRLILGAKGFLFPAEEDFGIAPLEALAAGLPVVVFGSGGVCDWMEPAVGESFMPQTAEACAAAMRRFRWREFRPARAQEIAGRFSMARFQEGLNLAVERAMRGYEPARPGRPCVSDRR
jgi:glycosyltransferase involved in cell wall biosynthesis